MLNKLLLGVLLVSLSACIKVRDPEKEAQKKASEAKVDPQVVSNIDYEVEPLRKYQQYAVRIKNLTGPASIYRTLINSKLSPVQVQGLEDVVEASGWVEYRIVHNGQEKTLRVEIPKDYLIEGDHSISSFPMEDVLNSKDGFEKKVSIPGRLFFGLNGRLVTNGLKVIIDAGLIDCGEGARVYTYIDQNPSTGRYPNLIYKNGDSGGLIYLRAKQLVGTLEIHMLGQHGSTGELNAKKHWKQRQLDGFNGGSSGMLYVDIKDMSKGDVKYNARPGKGGSGVQIVHTTSKTNNAGKVETSSHIIRPRGKDGNPGMVQTPCLLKNEKCEPIPRVENN